VHELDCVTSESFISKFEVLTAVLLHIDVIWNVGWVATDVSCGLCASIFRAVQWR